RCWPQPWHRQSGGHQSKRFVSGGGMAHVIRARMPDRWKRRLPERWVCVWADPIPITTALKTGIVSVTATNPRSPTSPPRSNLPNVSALPASPRSYCCALWVRIDDPAGVTLGGRHGLECGQEPDHNRAVPGLRPARPFGGAVQGTEHVE